jgi:TolB-like protein/Tfp pilus assembly protein PilF
MGDLSPGTPPSSTPPEDRLDSWKEIAVYLSRDVTTVQRWEKREGMPVHRHQHDRMGSVYAFSSELDAWVQSRRLSLEEEEKQSTAETPADAEADHGPGGAPRARRRSKKSWLVLAATFGIVLIAASVGYIRWSGSRNSPRQPRGRMMLAVLPFQNLTGDAGQEYFSDGMTEEMITQLSNLDPQHLGVIARTSVMHYKNGQAPLDQIGRELGAHYALEGSVRRDSNKVRITAQLVQMKDQSHLWSRTYDRDLSHLLALQGEIAREIADEIQVTLGDHISKGPARGSSSSPATYEAYDLYLRGQYFWNKRTVEGFQQAIAYFQEAIAKDPNYARAYAGLADSYALLGGYSMTPQLDFMQKARAAALRALDLDDKLPEAHTALAFIVQKYDWDWQTAEKEYRRAIELNPNYVTAHHWYAEHLAFRGRFDEAFAESERARQLDPLSLIIAADNGTILYYSRQYDRAIEKWNAVLAMDPAFSRAHLVRNAYVEKGRITDALADVENYHPADDTPWRWSALAYIYGRSGQRVQALDALRKLEQINRRQPMDSAAILWAHIGIGDTDQAFVWLEKAYTEHSNTLMTLKVEPGYDSLRGDPRFADLVRRVGLDQAR